MRLREFIWKHLTMRNLVVVWACAMITIAILRATDPEVLGSMTGAAATVVTGVIGILTVALRFHQKKKVQQDGHK